jgi:hypothetical protein
MMSRYEACMRIGEKPENLERKDALGGIKWGGDLFTVLSLSLLASVFG